MRLGAAAAALLVAVVAAGCGGGGSDEQTAASIRAATTTPSPANPVSLRATLAKIRRLPNAAAFCPLVTTHYIYENWGGPEGAGRKRCRLLGVHDKGHADSVDLVHRTDDTAFARLSALGQAVYLELVGNGSRWFVDGIGTSASEIRSDNRYFRLPGVRGRVTVGQLEGFLTRATPSTRSIKCRELTEEDLGEWECKLAVAPHGGPVKRGRVLYVIGRDGDVQGVGSGSVSGGGGCCIDLAPAPSS
jgi:hypothetical protein